VERSIREMRILRLSMQFAAFIMLFIFLACASTKIADIWKDETYQGPPKKILVINLFQDPSIRRIFEDEMVKALKDHKVDAVVKYTVTPLDTIVSDKDAIAALAKEVGADTVLITRPVATRMSAPGAYGGERDEYINTRTDVYDMKTSKLISFVTAETQIRERTSGMDQYIKKVPSYVKDIVNKLSKAGLF
jgi:hypothetical protein